MYSANYVICQPCQPCNLPTIYYVNRFICQPCNLPTMYSVNHVSTIGIGSVEKGRQIAGIILDSWARGRRKHVWFRSAYRDGEGCVDLGPALTKGTKYA